MVASIRAFREGDTTGITVTFREMFPYFELFWILNSKHFGRVTQQQIKMIKWEMGFSITETIPWHWDRYISAVQEENLLIRKRKGKLRPLISKWKIAFLPNLKSSMVYVVPPLQNNLSFQQLLGINCFVSWLQPALDLCLVCTDQNLIHLDLEVKTLKKSLVRPDLDLVHPDLNYFIFSTHPLNVGCVVMSSPPWKTCRECSNLSFDCTHPFLLL